MATTTTTPTTTTTERPTAWQQTACILCSINCGIEVRLDGTRFARVRGDKAHPTSQGYTCEKALRLDHYQNSRDRLTSPLRRRADGTYEEVDWDTAITEIAARFAKIRDTYGGEKIFYYGGGGQGTHLGGGFGGATRGVLGSRYSSNALAQEKTGEFWVDGQLFGRPRCHTTGDFEHTEVAVFVGKNPWQSHGFPRARTTLKEIARDPERALVVIDPRRTESADLADYHLQVRPGTDAFALAAALAVLAEEDLLDHAWLDEHARRLDELLALLGGVDITDYCDRAGVDEELVRTVARRIARAASVSIFEDLGIQQAPHSTLNSWLEKLIYLLTGNFGIEGGMNIHTRMASLGGGGVGGTNRVTPVGGHRIITGLIPAAVIPDEILTDHPDRFRAMLIESSNPVHSLPDSQRMRDALDALELVVVIDVAFTETARHADYVLPASSQFEKWEATFFTLEFPENAFHLRKPLLPPLEGTRPEPEIHRRLVRALGGYTDDDLLPLHEAALRGRAAYAEAFLAFLGDRPDLARVVPLVLVETLGPTLVEELGPGSETVAAVWGLCQTAFLSYPSSIRRAGYEDAEALFEAVTTTHSGIVFSVDPYDETIARMETPDKLVNLVVDELVDEFQALASERPPSPAGDDAYPFVLSAGERRSSTANTIYRDPSWMKNDTEGSLRMHPKDAASVGVDDGGTVRLTTRRGSVVAVVEVSDTLLPGHVSLPNGRGLDYPDESGERERKGAPPNELTSTDDRDWLAGTPWHKHVRARIEAVA
ncbi:MAG: molybdopterin-dependent oxidoreductase [Actinobacteria bacterium]|nr:molybdopterin-dependent oxidoreductase [Actinomycetota bacterium]